MGIHVSNEKKAHSHKKEPSRGDGEAPSDVWGRPGGAAGRSEEGEGYCCWAVMRSSHLSMPNMTLMAMTQMTAKTSQHIHSLGIPL